MLKVGLTGGIACGKSNALRHFSKLGAHTIDADMISREVVQPGRPAFDAVVRAFGPEIVRSDGTLDRKLLGSRIFANPAARARLNQIVHPHILEEEERQMARYAEEKSASRSPVVIVDAALMIETGSYRKYDVLIVVYCPVGVQLNRLQARERLTAAEALQRIQSQLPLVEKAHYGDYLIDTTGKLADTFEQVRFIYLELLQRYRDGDFDGPPGR